MMSLQQCLTELDIQSDARAQFIMLCTIIPFMIAVVVQLFLKDVSKSPHINLLGHILLVFSVSISMLISFFNSYSSNLLAARLQCAFVIQVAILLGLEVGWRIYDLISRQADKNKTE